MVTLRFKLSDIGTIRLDIEGPESFAAILQRCAAETAAEIGDVIATRDGKVLAPESPVQDNDLIDVFPAIAGG